MRYYYEINKNIARKAGIITFVIFLIITSLIIILIIQNTTAKYYPIKVKFRFIGDLKKGAPVKYLGGMKIGYVKDIYISGNYVEVLVYIKNGFKIKENSEFCIYTVGFVGARYIEVDPPLIKTTERYLKPGSTVWGNDAMGIEIIQQNLAKLSQRFIYSKFTEPPPPLPILLQRMVNSLYFFNNKILIMRPEFKKGLKIVNQNALNVLQNIRDMELKLNKFKKNLSNLKKEDILNYLSFIIQIEQIMRELNNSIESLADVSEKLTYHTDEIRDKKTSIGKLVYSNDVYKKLIDVTEEMCDITEEICEKPVFLK